MRKNTERKEEKTYTDNTIRDFCGVSVGGRCWTLTSYGHLTSRQLQRSLFFGIASKRIFFPDHFLHNC